MGDVEFSACYRRLMEYFRLTPEASDALLSGILQQVRLCMNGPTGNENRRPQP